MSNPTALTAEIQRHEATLSLTELGMGRMTKRAYRRRQNYINGLKQQLMVANGTELLEEIFG